MDDTNLFALNKIPLYRPRKPSFCTVFFAQSYVPVYIGDTPAAGTGIVWRRTFEPPHSKINYL